MRFPQKDIEKGQRMALDCAQRVTGTLLAAAVYAAGRVLDAAANTVDGERYWRSHGFGAR